MHLTKGLELLKTWSDTPERAQHELSVQLALGTAFMATRSYAAPETGQTYSRALALCQDMGDTPQFFPALRGIWQFHLLRGDLTPARVLGEQLLRRAQTAHDPALLIEAHRALGSTLYWRGECAAARDHFVQSTALYDRQQHRSHAFLYGLDPGVTCLTYVALALWVLGYPEAARTHNQEARTLAQELAHPVSHIFTLTFTTMLSQYCRETQATHAWAAAGIAGAREQGFVQWLWMNTFLHSWALAEQGHLEEGMAQMRAGMTNWQAMGADLHRPYFLALLAEACGKAGQGEAGLHLLTEALAVVRNNSECLNEAELYRLQGELMLHLSRTPQEGAEACFHKALALARQQHARSWELRAAMSLSRLWQQQGKRPEAHALLESVYGWFTEGFDTRDLQEARALLHELA